MAGSLLTATASWSPSSTATAFDGGPGLPGPLSFPRRAAIKAKLAASSTTIAPEAEQRAARSPHSPLTRNREPPRIVDVHPDQEGFSTVTSTRRRCRPQLFASFIMEALMAKALGRWSLRFRRQIA